MTLESTRDQILGLQSKILDSPHSYIQKNFAPEGTVITAKVGASAYLMRVGDTTDDLILFVPFAESHLYKKIRKFLYVPISPQNALLAPILVDLEKRPDLNRLLEADYKLLCTMVRRKSYFYPYEGRFLCFQPYRGGRIFSDFLGEHVSDTNYAFYLTSNFFELVKR